MNPLPIAVGVIINAKQQVLIARRPDHVDQGGLWEFPGGKIETDENPYQALCRELAEELGIIVTDAKPFTTILHDYPNYSVELHSWKVLKFLGEPTGWEGQEIKWVDSNALLNYSFPTANRALIQML